MSRLLFGVICGLAFGILDALIMLPLKFENRRKRYEALSGAFLERFMLGLLVPTVSWNLNPMAVGAILGLGLSLPTSLITRAYIPINAVGLVGGFLIGLLQVVLGI